MINILLLSFTVSDYKFNVSLYFCVFLITHPKIKLILHFIKQCFSNRYLLYDIATAMSSSRADPVLGHCPGWGYLNIQIIATALAGSI